MASTKQTAQQTPTNQYSDDCAEHLSKLESLESRFNDSKALLEANELELRKAIFEERSALSDIDSDLCSVIDRIIRGQATSVALKARSAAKQSAVLVTGMALRTEIANAEALAAGASNYLQKTIAARLVQQIAVSNNLPIGKIQFKARTIVQSNPLYIAARKLGEIGRLAELTEGQPFDEPIALSHLTTIRRKLTELSKFDPEA
jgi:hypothetical protein